MSLPALRISGDYLLIASIGFQLGMIELIKNLRFTGGASGVSGIPAFLVPSFGRVVLCRAGAACAAVAVVLLVRWIAHSDYGRAISAMRDDEVAFAALGRDAKWIKSRSSRWAPASPGLPARFMRTISASSRSEQFEILMSSTILTMVVVGGLRTPMGARGRRHPAADPAAGHHVPESAAGSSGTAAGAAVHGLRADFHVPSPGRIDAGRHYLDLDGRARRGGG